MVAEKGVKLVISLKTDRRSDINMRDVCAKPPFGWELHVQDKKKVILRNIIKNKYQKFVP